jgi:hypothetical protein
MEQDEKAPIRKPYTSPNLWVHGGFEELTRTIASFGPKVDGRGASADRRTV